MERCRYTFISKIGRFCALLLYPLVSLLLISIGLYILVYALETFFKTQLWRSLILLLFPVIAFFEAALLLKLSISSYRMENRWYAVSSLGLTLCCKQEAFYDWNQVSEIAIVAYAASANLKNYQTIICCFLKDRPDDFLKKILHSYIYGAINSDKFVFIDYSEHAFKKFSSYYPGRILDYRQNQFGL